MPRIWHKSYTRALISAIFFQLLVFYLGAFGGPQELFMAASCLISVGFWAGALTIVIRRPSSPTQGDLQFIRWGLFVMYVFIAPIAFWYWITFRHSLG